MPEQHVNFKLKPSMYFSVLLGITTVSCLIMTATLAILLSVKLIIMTGILVYGFTILQRHILLKHPRSLIALHRQADGNWQLHTAVNDSFLANLSGDSTVTRFASVLRFKLPEKRSKMSCVIFHDALDSDHYRRLIVLLRTTKL